MFRRRMDRENLNIIQFHKIRTSLNDNWALEVIWSLLLYQYSIYITTGMFQPPYPWKACESIVLRRQKLNKATDLFIGSFDFYQNKVKQKMWLCHHDQLHVSTLRSSFPLAEISVAIIQCHLQQRYSLKALLSIIDRDVCILRQLLSYDQNFNKIHCGVFFRSAIFVSSLLWTFDCFFQLEMR